MDSREKTRLDRIEEKIDKMAEAVVSLARAEEKIVEVKAAESESKLKSITAFIWTIITAVVAAVVSGVAWFNGSN
jgi:hypothetical protein